MVTMNVLDSAGAVVAIEKPLAPGRVAAAAARPVALSNEDLAALTLLHTDLITVLGGYVDGLEAGNAAILAKIIAAPATEASLAAVLAKLIAAPATEAKQDAANVLLTSLLAANDGVETLLGAATPAGENHIGAIGGNTVIIDVTLSLDVAAYGAGDVLADTQVVTNALRINDGTGVLQSITVIDQDDQKAALNIYLLSANVPMGAENALPSISDVDALNLLSAPIVIGTADYVDLGGVSLAGKDAIGKVVKAAAGTRNLYVAVVNGAGTPTYTAGGIKLRLAFLQD